MRQIVVMYMLLNWQLSQPVDCWRWSGEAGRIGGERSGTRTRHEASHQWLEGQTSRLDHPCLLWSYFWLHWRPRASNQQKHTGFDCQKVGISPHFTQVLVLVFVVTLCCLMLYSHRTVYPISLRTGKATDTFYNYFINI